MIRTAARVAINSKMYPGDHCNLTEFVDLTFESISIICNLDSNVGDMYLDNSQYI